MDQNLQKYAYTLLGYNGRVPLHILAEDTCSEVARLVGNQLAKKLPKSKVLIAKGKVKKRHHDLILMESHSRVDIIDPTVWQFQKYKKSILLGKGKTVAEALTLLQKKYGGYWHVSEQMNGYTKQETSALEHTLSKILPENRKAHITTKVA